MSILMALAQELTENGFNARYDVHSDCVYVEDRKFTTVIRLLMRPYSLWVRTFKCNMNQPLTHKHYERYESRDNRPRQYRKDRTMAQEPTLLELIILHLEERGHKIIGWRSQADIQDDRPVWLTVIGEPSVFIHNKEGFKVAISTHETTLATLDVQNPDMFDQLDDLLRKVYGGDNNRIPGASLS